jgi:hypothetical protein
VKGMGIEYQEAVRKREKLRNRKVVLKTMSKSKVMGLSWVRQYLLLLIALDLCGQQS